MVLLRRSERETAMVGGRRGSGYDERISGRAVLAEEVESLEGPGGRVGLARQRRPTILRGFLL